VILSDLGKLSISLLHVTFTHKGIPMDRQSLAEKIKVLKHTKQISWRQIAGAVGRSPGFITAALLGQMSLGKDEAETIGRLLSLDEDEIALLQQTPYRGSLPTAIPTDPLIYRFYEITQVFGTTLKELIEEEFGDGIMSAIDFELSVERIPDPKGDRVKVTLNGKFLPYRKY
jgi:cyanate lyase